MIQQHMLEGKCELVDDDGKPLKMLIIRVIMMLAGIIEGNYENADFDYDPYDEYNYEGHEIPDNIQSIYDNLDIKARGRKKK
nr:hypothetical protein [Tanacetum cinerariifolium]